MIRVMWLLRRKPGISFEQFRDRSSVRLIRCDRRETDTASCTPPTAKIAGTGGPSLWDT